MSESIYLLSEHTSQILIPRFHVCTWEFRNFHSIIELGVEIKWESIKDLKYLNISIYIPWLSDKKNLQDLYPSLKHASNSTFIFNSPVTNTSYINGNDHLGVIHDFSDGNRLCIIPMPKEIHVEGKLISFKLNLDLIKPASHPANLYFRFYIKTLAGSLPIRKNGISKLTILYDLRLNDMRNIPIELHEKTLKNKCKIESCFCLHIVPNDYDVGLEDPSLKSIRTLEFVSFRQYINLPEIRDQDLVVVFNKKKDEPFSFFTIFNKEQIGTSQFTAAFVVNLLCALLLYFPSVRNFHAPENLPWYCRMPYEFDIAAMIVGFYLVYLLSKAFPKITLK